MKNIGIIIIVYNILCLSIIKSDWYANNYAIIDFCDIPLYIGLAVTTFKGKLKYYQLYPIISSWLLLCLKLVYIHYPFEKYIFWNWVLIVLCGLLIIDERYNK